MNVLITGVAGFIGGRLASRLLHDGTRSENVEVVCIDSLTDDCEPAVKQRVPDQLATHPDFTLVAVDLCDGGW